jgi:tetratricopeptide (TPR) repeat protein
MHKQLMWLSILLLILCGSAWAAPEQWIEVKSDHFTLLTDSNEKQGRHVLDQFERMRWMFQTLFPKANVDPAQPIVVFAARNEKSFQALEPAAYLAKGQLHLGGLFLKTQDRNYVLLRLGMEEEHPFSTVYHEYTHLQFSGDSEWMPLWLDEGLAEFIQNTDIRDKDVHLGQPSFGDILYLRENSLMPLDILFKVDHNSPYYHEEQKGSVFYAESWALTHYLQVNDRVNHTHKVDDYMALVRNHEDPAVAAEKTFGDLKKLKSALDGYIHAGSYKEFVLSSAAAPIDEASYKVRPLSQSQADAVRADFLANVGRKEDALALIASVLQADPKNAQAFETKGYLAFHDGDQETARKWYSEAVKVDSQSYLAHYYFAAMSMGRSDPEQDTQIEASLRAAIRLNATFAPAYDLLSNFLVEHHQNLDEARVMNLHAIQLDRGNLFYRLNGSNVLMAMGRYADTIQTLRAASNLAKDPSDSALLKSRIEMAQQMLDAGTRTAVYTSGTGGVVEIKTETKIIEPDIKPRHPAEQANGPKHEAIGMLRGVQCSYPSVMEFQVVTPKKTISLYTNNYYKLELSSYGFDAKGEMNPCHDMEGFKARVQYAESSDKSVDGQAIAIELRK